MNLRQSSSALFAALIQLVQNRVELFGLELAQEKDRSLRLFTQAAIAAIFLLLSVAILSFLIIAIFWETPYRLWALGLLGLGYGLIGIIMLLRAKSNMASFEHAFTATVDELRRDANMFANTVESASKEADSASTSKTHSSSTDKSTKADER
jgi:uncharacterized membrane protein YqjE